MSEDIKTDELIQSVNKEIQAIRDFDLEIDGEKARELTMHYERIDPLTGKKEKGDRCLGDLLSDAMSAYELIRNTDTLYRTYWAMQFRRAMDKARATGVIKIGEGLPRKLRECQEQVVSLRRDMENLSGERDAFRRRYEECEALRGGFGRMEVGDVDEGE